MKTRLMIMPLAIAASWYPVVGMGGYVEGQEPNVVVSDCEISRDDKPHEINVYAVGSSSKSNPMPAVIE